MLSNSRFRIHSFDSLPSTQIMAREWVECGKAQEGEIFQADEQSAGYGRRGRQWQSPSGNLYFTLIEDYDPAHLNWLGYAMGLGLYDAIKIFAPANVALRLKWPNDVLLDKGKLSGLLLEVVESKILIGVGVNVLSAPESDQKTASLGPVCIPSQLLDAVLPRYEAWRRIGLTKGFDGLRDAWLERVVWLDETVTARLADGRMLEGRFVDVDATGALVLQGKNAHHVITAADIYLKTT